MPKRNPQPEPVQWDGRSLVKPFNWQRHLVRQPRAAGFEVLPFFDALLICLVVVLQASPFISQPGIRLELPDSATAIEFSSQPPVVLTVGYNGLFFFQGLKVSEAALRGKFTEYLNRLENPENGHLLIKADRNLSAEGLFEIVDLALDAGFGRVSLGGEKSANLELNWN